MQPFKRRESSEKNEDTRRDSGRSDQQQSSEVQEETSEDPAKTDQTDRPKDTERINTTVSEQGSQQEQGSQSDLQVQSAQSEAAADQVPEWNPSIDVFTKGEDFVIRAALAGVSREEVTITLSGGILTFSGQGQLEDSSEGYRIREIQRGPFSRSVSLPADRDSDKVKASLEDGVLEITVQGGATVTNEIRIGG